MFDVKVNKAKSTFFDRPKVQALMNKATRRVLSRFGAFVRRRARSSIRTRERVSLPGQPPSSHAGDLKQMILFGYDGAQESVIIGPAKLNAKGTDVPNVLECGGMTVFGYGPNRGKRVCVAARPYMGPAFQEELPGLPKMWQDSVR